MTEAKSGYVKLLVRNRQYIGQWDNLLNIVSKISLLVSAGKGFIIPVKHIVKDDTPNKFAAVEFTRLISLNIIDRNPNIPVRPMRVFEAQTGELSDNHIEFLHLALVRNNCCREQKENYVA